MDTRSRIEQLKIDLLSNALYASNYNLSEVLLACAYYNAKNGDVDTRQWLAFLARVIEWTKNHTLQVGFNSEKNDLFILSCPVSDRDLNSVTDALTNFFMLQKVTGDAGMTPDGGVKSVSIPISTMKSKTQEISRIIKKLNDDFKKLPTPRFDAFCLMREKLMNKYRVSAEKTDIFEEVMLRTFGVDQNLTGHPIEATHNAAKWMMNHRYEPDMLCMSLGIDSDSAQIFKNNFKAHFPSDIFHDIGSVTKNNGAQSFAWGFLLDNQNLNKLFEMLEATIQRDYVNGSLKSRLTAYQLDSGNTPFTPPVQTSTAALLSSIPTSTTTNTAQPNYSMTLGCRKYLEHSASRAEKMQEIYQQHPDIFDNVSLDQLNPYLCQLTNEPSFLPVIINGKNHDWNAVRTHIVGNKFTHPETKVEMSVNQITFNRDLIDGLEALMNQQLANKNAQQSSSHRTNNNNSAFFQPSATAQDLLQVYVKYSVVAHYITFEGIDARIKEFGHWDEGSFQGPSTVIYIPKSHLAEILPKLQNDQRIKEIHAFVGDNEVYFTEGGIAMPMPRSGYSL